MKAKFLTSMCLGAFISLCPIGEVFAASDLQAVIQTNRKKTITVTSISPEGWIEYTPVGGSKNKIFFKDIAKIDFDAKTREHTVITLDGKAQKLTRAWIFTSGSGSYLKFAGTYQDGKDADGTISGGEVASIVFARSAASAEPSDSVPQNAAAPSVKPAKATETAVSNEPVRPKIPSKRLPTGNLDYCYDALKDFNKAIAGLIEKFNNFKAEGKLFEKCRDSGGNDSWNWLNIQSEIESNFSGVITYYYSALKDGWELTDPDVIPLHSKIKDAIRNFEAVGYWTCFNPAEKLGAAMPDFFMKWEKTRLKAFEAKIVATEMKDAQKGQELMKNALGQFASFEKYFADESAEVHPAMLRAKTEVEKLAKECESAFKSAGNAKEEAYAAWEALNAERERLNNIMYEIENGQIHPNDYEAFIARLEKFENTDSTSMRQKIETLGRTCCTDLDKLEESMEKLLGKNSSGWDWSANVLYFDKILKAIPLLRKETADAIAIYASQDLDGMSSYSEEIRAQKFEELKKRVQLGLRYDPHNTTLIDLEAKVDEAANKDAAATAKLIAERKWPGNNKDFNGPGSPEELNKAALEYFNSTCRPVEKAHLACIIEPEWYCFKRNIFGQPIQWALTFKVAVDVEGETNDDEIYAWSISFLTSENVGVEKAPPFKMAAFNGKKRMKRANVPGLK